ncbi:MAG: polymer-forming cytoskeletal protein [Candidatus Omnitrophica bacterium]|nr:polymer-forming cytoskeletal protein [Candidatus Omnitrophota bacterium]
MALRKRTEEHNDKILDVDASMQGTLTFKDPVNLRINGEFEGRLSTKGNLTIGEHAVVKANIDGETIIVAGRINGEIRAQKELRLVPPARILGNIKTPILHVSEGAVLEGYCNMIKESKSAISAADMLTLDQVADYLEVDRSVVVEWADSGKLPATKEGSLWKFERSKIEDWLTSEKIK